VSAKPILFEAAMASSGNPFTLDRDGDATLRLQVPSQFVKVLADNLDRLFGCSFIVKIEGLTSKVDGK
jgi:hypothetical protein